MTTVYLVRHAKALSRRAWAGPDDRRPLSSDGRRQAEDLPRHLGASEIGRLASSPHVRCVETLEPLAEARRLEVEVHDELAEGRAGTAALEHLLELAEDGPVVACTHGDVLLDALVELRSAGVRLEGPLQCRKASTWVLETEDGSFTRGQYLEPPQAHAERHGP